MNLIINMVIVIWLYMTIVFLLACIKNDNSIVDLFWGLGFAVIACYSLIIYGNATLHNLILNLLVLLWAFRLSFHIYFRNKGKPEDFRYKAWRDTWKFFYLRSYLQIFMLQGFLMLIIACPVYIANFNRIFEFKTFDFIGIILFITGFYFETVGDFQLQKFKNDSDNKGKIITTGLWRLSRHPNYFGEALLWWGIGIFAFTGTLGWFILISPLSITLLLRFVSGVPMLEKKYDGRKDWEEYKQKTAAFVPFISFL